MADRKYLEDLSRRLADEGKLIEAGWVSLRLHAIPADASAVQLDNMHMVFMAGAQHLFASIMTIFDQEAELTDADMRRMELIERELDIFREELKCRFLTAGSA
jgi:hypothetical protein